MPTNLRDSLSSLAHPAEPPARKVAIVNGTPAVLTLVERALDAGNYDVVFIESVAHAYSHIKRAQPDLIIVCVRLGNMDGFDVLSMLHLDEDTRHIPAITFIAEFEGQIAEDDEEASQEDDAVLNPAGVGARMN